MHVLLVGAQILSVYNKKKYSVILSLSTINPLACSISFVLSSRYCGPLPVDGNTLRLMKAYHFAVLEGAYFKGRLFSSMCSEHKVSDADFFSHITPSITFPLASNTSELDAKMNKSWYLLAPLLSKTFMPFMASLGDTENILTRRNSWESPTNSFHDQAQTDWAKGPNKVPTSMRQGKKNAGKGALEHIDWDYLKLIAARVKKLKQPGIEFSEVKKGDIIMASHNPCIYKVLGVRHDLNLESEFPAEPSHELAEDKDSHEVKDSTFILFINASL